MNTLDTIIPACNNVQRENHQFVPMMDDTKCTIKLNIQTNFNAKLIGTPQTRSMDNENRGRVTYKFPDCRVNEVYYGGSDIEEKYPYVRVRTGCCRCI